MLQLRNSARRKEIALSAAFSRCTALPGAFLVLCYEFLMYDSGLIKAKHSLTEKKKYAWNKSEML